ncbi:MAG: hypothetical protein GX552_02395 [Chloroflexi bacterium]|jgi:mannosyltransferase|nr:hypothetical protein [Chloroflexota bacterium]
MAPLESRPDARPSARLRDHWILVLLVLASFALHLWRIEAKGIWWDESLSLYRARFDLLTILSNRITFPGHLSHDLHPPLYFVQLYAMIRAAGESDLVLRLPAVGWATLLVPLLYAMGVRLRGRRAGLIAATLGTLSPFYLWYAQEARMYTMVAALALASIYTLWRVLAERNWKWGLACALITAAAIATQYLFILLLPIELVIALCLRPPRLLRLRQTGQPRPALKRPVVLALVGGAVVLLPILGVLGYRAWRLIPTLAPGRTYIALPAILADALHVFSLGLSWKPHGLWPYHLLFGLVFLGGLISLWRRPPTWEGAGERAVGRGRGAAFTLLLGAILFPAIVMWFVSLFVPIYMGSRYLIASSPAFYLGLAVGLDALVLHAPTRPRRALAAVPAVALGLTLLAGMAYSDYQYFYDPAFAVKEDHRAAAEVVARHERVGDVVVVTAPENVPAFEHYYQGHLPIVGLPRYVMTGDPDPDEVAADLAALTNEYDRIWLVHCRIEFSDPKERVTTWLDGNTMLLDRWSFPSTGSLMTVSSYLTQHPQVASPAPATPPAGTFGEQLALVDYVARYRGPEGNTHQLTRPELAGDPAGLPPVGDGQSLALTLYWQALAELPAYKTSLRLVDGNGVLWAQEDREPYMYYPTDQWPTGEMVRHETGLRVPPGTPPGVYHLQLWVYRADTGESLGFHEQGATDAAPCALLGQVVVGPVMRTHPAGTPLSPRLVEREFMPEGVTRPRLSARFGPTLQLLGYAATPDQARGGDRVQLDLYWQAQADVEVDGELVVNWQDEAGHTWHTATHSLTGSDYPTTAWQAGQLVRGIVRVKVPEGAPAGTHTLHLLVRDRATGEFLSLQRGLLLWAGHDLPTARVTILPPAEGN